MEYLAIHVNNGSQRVVIARNEELARRKLPGRGIDYIIQEKRRYLSGTDIKLTAPPPTTTTQ